MHYFLSVAFDKSQMICLKASIAQENSFSKFSAIVGKRLRTSIMIGNSNCQQGSKFRWREVQFRQKFYKESLKPLKLFTKCFPKLIQLLFFEQFSCAVMSLILNANWPTIHSRRKTHWGGNLGKILIIN